MLVKMLFSITSLIAWEHPPFKTVIVQQQEM